MASKAPWVTAEQVSDALPASREPAIAVIGETAHLVWNSRGTLCHAVRGASNWSKPVPVAMGAQPALAAGAAGDLHCLFSNAFAGNFEIYHVIWQEGKWSLPVNISHTTGASTRPVLAAGQDGDLHAAWMDDTPGRPIIYYGLRDLRSGLWSSQPIPNAQGLNPTLGVAPNGDVFAAWQDRDNDTSPYEVYCAQLHTGSWGLPENISTSPTAQSIQPNLTVDAQGYGHLVWQEQQDNIFQIAYCQRVPGGWTNPSILSTPGADSRLPHLASAARGFTELVWLEGASLRSCSRMPVDTGYWSEPEVISPDLPNVADLAIAMSITGHAHLVWTCFVMGNSLLFYAEREPLFNHVIYFPAI